ncbi:hypothetical protein OS493_017645 [Desmophyllum pertusum]|uniref:Uncharacterized protein n=1 Tax=Desmophyllum pertusum TaxID=174260 RepID=A0A9W9ZCP9_9CNID|nr:hypothetical protein OS493_017645 [Desmophyllum pertusum]
MKEDRENRGFSGFQTFEGDMMLPLEQVQAAEHGLDPTNLGGARGLKRLSTMAWRGSSLHITFKRKEQIS